MELLYRVPVALHAVGMFLLILLSIELGHRLSHSGGSKEGFGTLQAAVLALVGLLLAFTFSIGEGRFNARRLLVVQEANAIGTLYLRTGFLTNPVRGEMRGLLHRYIQVRIEAQEAGNDTERFNRLLGESDDIHRRLWVLLETEGPTAAPPVLLLMTQAMNDVIDVAGERVAAARNRIPPSILLLLMFSVLVAGFLSGYRPEGEQRGLLLWVVFAMLLTGVLATLTDLDRPRQGFIQTGQQPLIDTQRFLRNAP